MRGRRGKLSSLPWPGPLAYLCTCSTLSILYA
ncbi:hypothetical protein ID866_13005 [Astraeus odoratus]|nr:hypothetical protein ID866_13005 [Astraeus odoratus]